MKKKLCAVADTNINCIEVSLAVFYRKLCAKLFKPLMNDLQISFVILHLYIILRCDNAFESRKRLCAIIGKEHQLKLALIVFTMATLWPVKVMLKCFKKLSFTALLSFLKLSHSLSPKIVPRAFHSRTILKYVVDKMR